MKNKIIQKQELHLERILEHSLRVNQDFHKFYRYETCKKVPPEKSMNNGRDIPDIFAFVNMLDRQG